MTIKQHNKMNMTTNQYLIETVATAISGLDSAIAAAQRAMLAAIRECHASGLLPDADIRHRASMALDEIDDLNLVDGMHDMGLALAALRALPAVPVAAATSGGQDRLDSPDEGGTRYQYLGCGARLQHGDEICCPSVWDEPRWFPIEPAGVGELVKGGTRYRRPVPLMVAPEPESQDELAAGQDRLDPLDQRPDPVMPTPTVANLITEAYDAVRLFGNYPCGKHPDEDHCRIRLSHIAEALEAGPQYIDLTGLDPAIAGDIRAAVMQMAARNAVQLTRNRDRLPADVDGWIVAATRLADSL